MTDYKHFRVIVDLSAFFYDHRRVARVFVKKNLKSIADLQNRISDIFEISEFYLTTGGHFLPALEDIRVLSNNESVCVIPNNPQKIAVQQEEHISHKRHLEPIFEDSNETPTEKKTKSKKKHVKPSSSYDADEAPRKKRKSEKNEFVVPDETLTTKGRRGTVQQNDEHTRSKQMNSKVENEELPSKHSRSIVEREICNIESSQKLIDVKKKLKQKTDEYIKKHSKETSSSLAEASSNIKNVLPKLQSHIKNCNDLGRSNGPDTVRLSRHVDTPIKISRYTPPLRITDKYLAKKKINIVKIDIVKEGTNDLTKEENMSQSSASSDNKAGLSNENVENSHFSHNLDESQSPPKNYVKEVISTFEKNNSPELQNQIHELEVNGLDTKGSKVKASEASNYTKAYLDQNDSTTSKYLEGKTDIAVNFDNNFTTVDSVSSCLSNNPKDQDSLLKTEEPQKTSEYLESTNISMDISSIDPCTSYYISSQDTSLNSINTSLPLDSSSVRSKHTTTSRKFGGVGSLLGLLRESDSVISQESDTSCQYVTKRKRIRKHRRKSKKTDEEQKLPLLNIDTRDVKPMNVKACPSIHIKFEDNEMDTMENKYIIINSGREEENGALNNSEDSKYKDKLQTTDGGENKPFLIETMVLSDENDPIMENKSIFGEESISKAPLMTDKLEPKVGDVIAFKVLKITENYTPQMSNYVVGKLETYLKDKSANFKILRGAEELLPPSGKLSLKEDEDVQIPKYKAFLWTELFEPKLLYP